MSKRVNVNGVDAQKVLAQAMSEKLGLKHACNMQEYYSLDGRLRQLISIGRRLGISEELIEDSFAFSCRLYEEANGIQWIAASEKPFSLEMRYAGNLYEWISIKFTCPRSADLDLDIKSLHDLDWTTYIADAGRSSAEEFIGEEQENEGALIEEWNEELCYIKYDKLTPRQQSDLWKCIPPFVTYRVCYKGRTVCNGY